MKRLIIGLFVLFSVLSLYSQSIVGSWKMDDKEDGTMLLNTFFTFSQKDSLKFEVFCKQSADFGKFTIVVTVPGKYVLKGKKLFIESFKKDATAKLEDVEFSEETKNLFKEVPNAEKTIMEMLENATSELKDVLSNSDIDGEISIIKITDTILEVSSDSGSLVLTKYK